MFSSSTLDVSDFELSGEINELSAPSEIQSQLKFIVYQLEREHAYFNPGEVRILSTETKENQFTFRILLRLYSSQPLKEQYAFSVPVSAQEKFNIPKDRFSQCFRLIKETKERLRDRYYAYWRPHSDCPVNQATWKLEKRQPIAIARVTRTIEPWKNAVILFSQSDPSLKNIQYPDLQMGRPIDFKIVEQVTKGDQDAGLKKLFSVGYLLGKEFDLIPQYFHRENGIVELTLANKERQLSIFYQESEDVPFAEALQKRLMDPALETIYYSGHSFYGKSLERLQNLEVGANLREFVISSCTAFYYLDFERMKKNAAALYITRNEGFDQNAQMVLDFFHQRAKAETLDFYSIGTFNMRFHDFTVRPR